MKRPINVFVSYDPKDTEFKIALERHLSSLIRNGKIILWADNQIALGSSWDLSVRKNLNKSDLLILLLSNDFMSSDKIWEVEIKESLERRQRGDALLILPIMVRPCDIEGTFISAIQRLPRELNQSISTAQNQDESWTKITIEIRQIVDDFDRILMEASTEIERSTSTNQLFGQKNIISGSVIIVGGNLHIGDIITE
jgi:hypothetical protein